MVYILYEDLPCVAKSVMLSLIDELALGYFHSVGLMRSVPFTL